MRQTKLNHTLVERARNLRKEMTCEERKLWYLFLSKHNVRWYRQRVMGDFILDFYCSKAHVAIEVDGKQHYTPQGKCYDAERSAKLRGYGIDVLRFSNDDIRYCFDKACSMIDAYIQSKI